jgi:cytochrome b561
MSTPDIHAAPHQADMHGATFAGTARMHLPVAKVLHWSLAVLVMLLVMSGIVMKQLGEGLVSQQLYTLHKTVGAIALLLIITRVAYRLWASITGRWRNGAGSQAIHYILYVAMLLVPLLGWAGVSDYGARGIVFGYSLPMIWPEGAGYAEKLFAAHAWLSFGLLALVTIHIGVAVEDYVMRGRASAHTVRES